MVVYYYDDLKSPFMVPLINSIILLHFELKSYCNSRATGAIYPDKLMDS
jgi:hypothetical protein